VNSRLRNVVVGVAVLVAGLAGLFLPVSAFDGSSSTVTCGNAVTAEAPVTTSAPVIDQAVPHPDLAAACAEAISSRRHWAIPLVLVGVVGVLVGLFFRGRRALGGRPR
jgi:uncharacterized membrane protein HdeD (DUF308 family)